MLQGLPPHGHNVSLLCRDEHCSVYRIKDETGEGQVTCYPVFPGIVLQYNDFHMESWDPGVQTPGGTLSINHCREGRMEWEFQKNQFIYLETGDLQISSPGRHNSRLHFPLCHYHGLTVNIFLHQVIAPLAEFLIEHNINLTQLMECVMCCNAPLIMRTGTNIEHIISELYDVPPKIRAGYQRIKVMELLLCLSTLDLSIPGRERLYFHRTQVEKIREIRNLLEKSPHCHYTLAELASMFDIGMTTMKRCFKAVYGASIYSYIRAYRMNAATVLLRREDHSIGQIATAMGYENASKFSAAFKEVIGLTPSEYRKSTV